MASNNKQWNNNGGRINVGQGTTAQQPEATTQGAEAGTERVERERGLDTSGLRRGGIGRRDVAINSGGRRQRGDEVSYVNINRRRTIGSSVTQHTELLMNKFSEILAVENAKIEMKDTPIGLVKMARDSFNLPYDVIVVSQTAQVGTTPCAHYMCFVIAASRGELEKISFDDRRVVLPNVCGDTPDDNNKVLEIIQDAVDENAHTLFDTTEAVSCGVRVIEAQAQFDEKDESQFISLISDAVESINTFIENFDPNMETFDWSNVATGSESGLAVVNAVDYDPQPLTSSTGMPIHRQFVLRTSAYESTYNGSSNDTRPISEISAFIDFRYGQAEHEGDPAWMPVAVITDLNSDAGGNILEYLLIGLGNTLQMKEDLQSLPAVDWRKKDPKNDIGMLGWLEPELFGLEKPDAINISSVDEFFEVGRKGITNSLEIAMDVSNTDRQSWAGLFLGGAVELNSEIYDMWIASGDNLSGGKFSELFLRPPQGATTDIIIDADNFQIGGFYHGLEHERRDGREIGHLAVIAHDPKNIALVEEYDDITIGGIDVPYRNLSQQLHIKEEIAGRITVTTYIRRYTFNPWFLECLYEALKVNYLIAPLDGAIAGPRERKRWMSSIQNRGSNARRGYGRSGGRR